MDLKLGGMIRYRTSAPVHARRYPVAEAAHQIIGGAHETIWPNPKAKTVCRAIMRYPLQGAPGCLALVIAASGRCLPNDPI